VLRQDGRRFCVQSNPDVSYCKWNRRRRFEEKVILLPRRRSILSNPIYTFAKSGESLQAIQQLVDAGHFVTSIWLKEQIAARQIDIEVYEEPLEH